MENFIPLEKIVGGKGGEVKYDGRLPGAVHNGGGRGEGGFRSCELHAIVAGSVNLPSPR